MSLTAAGPLLAGCGASDFSFKDAEWFNRPSRVFNSSLSIETPPLSTNRPVAPDDLISAEGLCSGMSPATNANAMSDSTQAVPDAVSANAGIAIGRTECEVARAAGVPDNVSSSNGERGERLTVLTYMRGPRPGIYRFTGGRLVSMERGPEVSPPPRAPKGQKAKRQG